jgi:hypothetical protein
MKRLVLLTVSTLLMLGACGGTPVQTTKTLTLEQVFSKYSDEVVQILATSSEVGAM